MRLSVRPWEKVGCHLIRVRCSQERKTEPRGDKARGWLKLPVPSLPAEFACNCPAGVTAGL